MAGTTPHSGEGESYHTIRVLSPQVIHGIEPSIIRTVHLTDEPETSRDLPPIYFPSPTSLGRSATIPDFEDGDLEELMTWQAQLYDGYSERQEVIEKQYAITHKLRTLHQELVDKGLGTANIARLKRQAEQLYSDHENMERSMHNLYTPEYIQGLERQIRRLQKQSERGGEEAGDEDEGAEPSVGTLRAEVQAALGRKAAQEKCLQAAEMVQMQANGTRNHNLTSWREQLQRACARQDRMGHLLDEEELALTLAKEQRTAVTCRLEKLREDVARLREQRGRSEQLGEGLPHSEADSYGSRSDPESNEQDTVEHTPPPLFSNIAPSAEIDSPPSSVNDSMIVPPIPPGLMELDSEGSQAPDMMSSSDSQSTRLGSKSASFLTHSNNRPFPGSASKLSLFSYSRSGESLDGYYTGMDSMDPGSPPGSPLLWMSGTGSRHRLGTADETTDDESVMAAFRQKVSTSMPVAMGQANPHLAPFITSPAPPPPPGSIPPTLIASSTPQPMVLQPPPAAHTQVPMQFVPPTVVQVV